MTHALVCDVVVEVFEDCRCDELMHAFLPGMRPFMACVTRAFVHGIRPRNRTQINEFRVNDPVAAQKAAPITEPAVAVWGFVDQGCVDLGTFSAAEKAAEIAAPSSLQPF